jgi:hypothetical protein
MKKKNLYIFEKYINNNQKSIPLKIRDLFLGEVKYLPPVSKEWKNNIYSYNFNILKNLPIHDININNLIRSYFNSYFNYKFIQNKYKPRRFKRLSMNKIYISKAEIKHTNSKALLTLYTYNREKISLLKKIKFLKKSSYININIIMKLLKNKSNKLFGVNSSNIYVKIIKKVLFRQLTLFRRYKLRLNLNKYKFEEKLIYILSSIIGKHYNKKVEFNIVNMKSVILNSDIFTKILSLKLKNRKANILRMMNILLNKVVLPKVNRIIETGWEVKSVNFNLLENKYKNMNLNSILASNSHEEGGLDNILNKEYYNVNNNAENDSYGKIYNIIFNNIKYKNMGGVRLEIKGRLTRRYRADRALYKVRWKGGLKNIDSSYKGLSSVNMRGYLKPNVEYSIYTSKRRIGAFAVKGWISGK